MRYYRVKPQYDNYKLSREYEIFVGNELLTETEYKKSVIEIRQQEQHTPRHNSPVKP